MDQTQTTIQIYNIRTLMSKPPIYQEDPKTAKPVTIFL